MQSIAGLKPNRLSCISLAGDYCISLDIALILALEHGYIFQTAGYEMVPPKLVNQNGAMSPIKRRNDLLA